MDWSQAVAISKKRRFMKFEEMKKERERLRSRQQKRIRWVTQFLLVVGF